MEINSANYRFSVDGEPSGGERDLGSVLLHEVGHFLGLSHSGDRSAVMYAYYAAQMAALTQDDIDGICAIYPPDGTRVANGTAVQASACDGTPRHGFSSQCGSLAPPNDDEPKGGCSMGGGQTRSGIPLIGLIGIGWLARRRRAQPGSSRPR